MANGEDSEAAQWLERAARSPGAHALIAMIAAAVQLLAGNEPRARSWAANVRERNPLLTHVDFFRAFPMQSESMRTRLLLALQKLGF